MGWLARVIVPSVASVAVGCAAIADLGDAQTTDEQNSGTSSGMPSSSGAPTSSGAPGSSGTAGEAGTSGQDGAMTMAEAGVDAAPACKPPKVANDQPCKALADCCSNACATNHKCNDKCSTGGGGSFSCDPLQSDQCCVGFYCSANAFGECAACRATGTPAEVDQGLGGGSVLVESSCCSGHADQGTRMCTP